MSTPRSPRTIFDQQVQLISDTKTQLRKTTPKGKMERLLSIEDKMKAHFRKNESLWIGRELSKLTKKYMKPEFHHPTPYGMARHRISPGILAQRAEIIVKSRIRQRIRRLNSFKRNLGVSNGKTKTKTMKHRMAFNKAQHLTNKGPRI